MQKKIFVDLIGPINIISTTFFKHTLRRTQITPKRPPLTLPTFIPQQLIHPSFSVTQLKLLNEPIKRCTSAWAEMHLLMAEIRSQEYHVRIASRPHYHGAISHHSYPLALALTPSEQVFMHVFW